MDSYGLLGRRQELSFVPPQPHRRSSRLAAATPSSPAKKVKLEEEAISKAAPKRGPVYVPLQQLLDDFYGAWDGGLDGLLLYVQLNNRLSARIKCAVMARVVNRMVECEVPVFELVSRRETIEANPDPFVAFLSEPGTYEHVMRYEQAVQARAATLNELWCSWPVALKLFASVTDGTLVRYLGSASVPDPALLVRAMQVAAVLATVP